MKYKILGLVGLLAVVFIGAVIWRMDAFIREDRSNWAQAQMRTQILSLQQSAESSLKQLKKAAPLFQANVRDKNFWTAIEPVSAMAWVRDLSNPSIENTAFKDGSGLDDTALMGAMKELQGKRSRKNRLSLYPWKDGDKNWIMIVWQWNESRNLILWAGPEFLQGLVEAHKGSLSQLAVLNEEGQVLAHSRNEYFGTRLNDHPMFKQSQSAGAEQGGGSYQDSGGQAYLGYFGPINGSNTTVMASSAHHELLADKNKVWASFVFIGLGLTLFTLGGIAMLKPEAGGADEKQVTFAPPSVRPPPPKPAPAPPPKALEPKTELNAEARGQAYKKIASSIGHELRGPLMRILGFGQMIQDQEKNSEIQGYADSILRETRLARDILEKLFSFAQEKDMTTTNTSLSQIVKNVLGRVQPELIRKEVKLFLDMKDAPTMKLAEKPLEKALENMIQNAVEAMSRRPKKELHISVTPLDHVTELVISDSGEGIEPGNIQKIFDPFFTTRSFTNHMGLGLSAAYGVIRQHGGDIKVESEIGNGTKFTVSIPNDVTTAQVSPLAQHVPADIPVDPVSFSPADVEIEKLLEFTDADTNPIGLVNESSINQQTAVDEDRTVVTSVTDQNEDELLLLDDVKTQPLLARIDKAVFKPEKKSTELDQYQVTIRRPRGRETNS